MEQEAKNTSTDTKPAEAGVQPGWQTQQAGSVQNNDAASRTEAKPVDLKHEDLIKSVGFEHSLEEENALLKRRYEASSNEAIRLKKRHDSISKASLEQGIEIVVDKEGRFAGFRPTEKFSPELGNLKFDADDLTERDKSLLEDEPIKAVESIVNRALSRAQKAYTRHLPTNVEPEREPLTDSRFSSAVEFLAARKDPVTGDMLYPNISGDRQLLKDMVGNGLPDAVKRAVDEAPDVMLELLYGRIVSARSRLTAWAERQAANRKAEEEKKASESNLQPSGVAKSVIVDGASDDTKKFLASLKSR